MTWQIDAFRRRYAEIIAAKSPAVISWFRALPLYEWVPLRIRSGEEEILIGLLCLLYQDGIINMSFSSDMCCIRHEAGSPEEYREWLANHSCSTLNTQ